jgi:glyoxylase-like metal-dependent hydrolase (beta-lactamase superfamily II)
VADIQVLLQGFSASTSEGMLAYCGVTLVRGEHTTLVDVGYQARQGLLLERLHAAGVRRDEVDRVVLTHAHWDHALNLLAFPNAEIVISRDELDYVQQPNPQDWATPAYTADIFSRCARVTTVTDGDELERGVRVMALPGHSPGSMGVLVETPDGAAGIVGDALPSRAAAMSRTPMARIVFYDEEMAQRSGRKVVDLCRFVYPGHDRPFRIEAGSFAYTEPQSLRFLGLPRDEDGTVHAALDEAEAPFEPAIQPFARRAGSGATAS